MEVLEESVVCVVVVVRDFIVGRSRVILCSVLCSPRLVVEAGRCKKRSDNWTTTPAKPKVSDWNESTRVVCNYYSRSDQEEVRSLFAIYPD